MRFSEVKSEHQDDNFYEKASSVVDHHEVHTCQGNFQDTCSDASTLHLQYPANVTQYKSENSLKFTTYFTLDLAENYSFLQLPDRVTGEQN